MGLAFNYVAGEESKMADASKILKNSSSSPPPKPSSAIIAKSEKVEINPTNLDYVESAALKAKPSSPIKSAVMGNNAFLILTE